MRKLWPFTILILVALMTISSSQLHSSVQIELLDKDHDNLQKHTFHPCYIPPKDLTTVVKTPLKMLSEEELPEEWFWGNVEGKNYLTVVKNQHIPIYCGSCWSFATTSALSDRIKIMRKGAWPDFNLSPQVLLSCNPNTHGCQGGNSLDSYRYIYQNNITDETCSNYQALGWTNGLGCSADIKCKSCMPDGCGVPDSYRIYGVEEFGMIQGEAQMMNEIYQRGPITCSLAATPELGQYTGGIFIDQTGITTHNHVVSVVGYGVEAGVKYWIIRNSWGSYWGEKGFFRLIRGVNNLGVETFCTWAVPRDTWTTDDRNYTNVDTTNSDQNNLRRETITKTKTWAEKKMCQKCRRVPVNEEELPSIILGPQPWEYLTPEDLPKAWDWRNVSGINYLSWNRNEHIPQYCGSCWVFAATSALSDRINIQRRGKFPQVSLSPQAVINCRGGGSCHGGSSFGVYDFALRHGIPEDSCQNYEAVNGDGLCTPIDQCKNCKVIIPPNKTVNPFMDIGQQECMAVERFKKWRVGEYGRVKGPFQMKSEIFERGPIHCGMQVTENFLNYQEGVYSEKPPKGPLELDHEISVVGWGITGDGTEYWICRNAWGTYWGDHGFFMIQMYEDNLGIETSCGWGAPLVDDE